MGKAALNYAGRYLIEESVTAISYAAKGGKGSYKDHFRKKAGAVRTTWGGFTSSVLKAGAPERRIGGEIGHRRSIAEYRAEPGAGHGIGEDWSPH